MVRVNDREFNLRKIMNSGQCFRIFIVEERDDITTYDVLSMDHFVRVYHVHSEGAYLFNCTDDEWEYWRMYFDLDTDYKPFYEAIDKFGDRFLRNAARYGQGMKILRQSYWETLISFIISQNNNIPRIKKSIELLCEKFGKPLDKYGVIRYSFPYADDLKDVSIDDLADLGLGYRTAYIYNVCKCAPALIMADYDKLLKVPGIGKKVASCIMLFGAHDLSQFPIDTWMTRLLNEIYDGNFDTDSYKGFEGFIQQLLFYYYRFIHGK